MTFQGVAPATLLQALGVTAAAVTALYLLKLRRRRVTVPFSPLWTKLLAEPRSRAPLHKLKRWLSWLLALALLAALAGAAGDPRADERAEDRRSWVVLLDASASMRAGDGTPTRFDDARREAMRVVDSLRGGDTAMIVRVDADVTPLTPLTSDRRTLSDAVAAARPGEAAADLRRALRFADATLHGRPGGWIVIVSDLAGEAPDDPRSPGAPPVSWAPVGARGDNVGILGFNARPYRANRRQYEVFLRLRNDGAVPAECRVAIHADGILTEVLSLSVPPGRTVDRLFPDLVVEGRRIEARLEVVEGPDNLLPVDDVAYALLPAPAPLRVGLVTPGNLFLEAALLLDDNIEVVVTAPGPLGDVSPPPDAWVFDRWAPSEPVAAPALYIAPPAGGSPWPRTGVTVAEGLVRVKADHPLGRWVGLPDLGAPEVARIRTAPHDAVVMRAGGAPLVVARAREGLKPPAVIWTFDPLESDLPLKAAFPLMLMHTFEWFARGSGDTPSSWSVGRSWKIPVRSDATTAQVLEPGGQRRVVPVSDGHARMRGRQTGFHEVTADGADAVIVAASLHDPEESAIAPSEARVQAARQTPPPTRRAAAGGHPPWLLLGLFALVWLALEWGSFHRRWTV